jgi:dihydroneopterin aldolase
MEKQTILIELLDMRFYAHHGCFEEERQIGTYFSVDVCIEAPKAWTAVQSDRLEDTLNYQSVYNAIKQEMEQPSRLLEHVAGRMAHRLKADFPHTGKIRLSLAKLHPPLGGQVGASRIVLTME